MDLPTVLYILHIKLQLEVQFFSPIREKDTACTYIAPFLVLYGLTPYSFLPIQLLYYFSSVEHSPLPHCIQVVCVVTSSLHHNWDIGHASLVRF